MVVSDATLYEETLLCFCSILINEFYANPLYYLLCYYTKYVACTYN